MSSRAIPILAIILASLAVLASIPAFGQQAPAAAKQHTLQPDICVRVHAILDAVYRLDYTNAARLAAQLKRDQPKHPAGYVYLARTYWSEELNRTRQLSVEGYVGEEFFHNQPAEVDPATEERFATAADEAIKVAKAWETAHRKDPDALYLLAVANEVKASWEFTIKHGWTDSWKMGATGYSIQKELAKKGLADARISTGTREYVLGTLPLFLRGLVGLLLFDVGSEEDGIRDLEYAVQRGDLASDDARALLAVFYGREEKYAESASHLRALNTKYPENWVLPVDLGFLAVRREQPQEAIGIYQQVLDKEFPDLEQALVLVRMGVAARLARDYAASAAYLRRAIEGGISKDVIASAHLELGKTLDIQKNREQALAEYRLVSHDPSVSDIRKKADQYLRRAFR